MFFIITRILKPIFSYLVTPILGLVVDGKAIQSNETISLVNGPSFTYKIICSSVNSKPDVNLALYDTNSLISLSNGLNNKSSGLCDSNNLCTRVLQVDFQFFDPRLNNMSSLTCAAVSNNPNASLSATLVRSVSVTIATTSNLMFIFEFNSNFNL